MIAQQHTTRGQSEVLGYIVTFSVIFLAIGSIYVSGVASLETHQASAELNNAEQAMFVFADNVDDIVQHESPRRSVEMKTTDSSVGTTPRHNVTVSVDGAEQLNTSIRGFAYRGEAGDIVYESGAIIRTQDGGVMMQRAPPLKFTDERVILNVVRLAGEDSYQGSGTSLTVLERAISRSSTEIITPGSDVPVTIRLDTAPKRAPAWRTYFEEQGLTQVTYDPDAGIVEYEYSATDQVLVRESFLWVYIEE